MENTIKLTILIVGLTAVLSMTIFNEKDFFKRELQNQFELKF